MAQKSAKKIALAGSERKIAPGAVAKGAAPAEERLEVTVLVRGKKPLPSADQLLSMAKKLPGERKYLTREELAAQNGADPDDVAKVEAFATSHNLTVVRANLAERSVKLSGTVDCFNAAFGVNLKMYKSRDITYRGRTGAVHIPAELHGIVTGVHGLDNRPIAKPHFRLARTSKRNPNAKNAPGGSLAVPDIAKLYNFPAGFTGKGQCIALIELNDFDPKTSKITGTGYKTSDLSAYFKSIKVPMPKVVSVGVDGGINLPGNPNSGDVEVVLDIEVAGAAAPGATIAVYFAPNTTNGFIDAVKAAVHDTVRKPSVISISWGGPEDLFGQTSQQFFTGMDQAFQEAAALGVTVTVAAGDNGSADVNMAQEQWDKKPHADFPCSDPFAMACGGTKLMGSGATISSEVVWNEGTRGGAGGGGVSNVWPLPSYQSAAKVPKSPTGKKGRGVPDVAGDADPATGYQIFVNGSGAVVGGTSAVAPLMAGLVACINERLAAKTGKTAGFLNPLIYGAAGSAFRDITQGNNDLNGSLKGKYTAGKGWDACTGVGVADGAALLKALGG